MYCYNLVEIKTCSNSKKKSQMKKEKHPNMVHSLTLTLNRYLTADVFQLQKFQRFSSFKCKNKTLFQLRFFQVFKLLLLNLFLQQLLIAFRNFFFVFFESLRGRWHLNPVLLFVVNAHYSSHVSSLQSLPTRHLLV